MKTSSGGIPVTVMGLDGCRRSLTPACTWVASISAIVKLAGPLSAVKSGDGQHNIPCTLASLIGPATGSHQVNPLSPAASVTGLRPNLATLLSVHQASCPRYEIVKRILMRLPMKRATRRYNMGAGHIGPVIFDRSPAIRN